MRAFFTLLFRQELIEQITGKLKGDRRRDERAKMLKWYFLEL